MLKRCAVFNTEIFWLFMKRNPFSCLSPHNRCVTSGSSVHCRHHNKTVIKQAEPAVTGSLQLWSLWVVWVSVRKETLMWHNIWCILIVVGGCCIFKSEPIQLLKIQFRIIQREYLTAVSYSADQLSTLILCIIKWEKYLRTSLCERCSLLDKQLCLWINRITFKCQGNGESISTSHTANDGILKKIKKK